MKLLLHNMLSSKFMKGVNTGFPLLLRATKIEKLDLDTDDEARHQFARQMIPRLDYKAFRDAAMSVFPVEGEGLPEELPQKWEGENEFLKKVYSLLVGVEVVEGELECPETKRIFPINEGIPNMLVRSEEVDE